VASPGRERPSACSQEEYESLTQHMKDAAAARAARWPAALTLKAADYADAPAQDRRLALGHRAARPPARSKHVPRAAVLGVRLEDGARRNDPSMPRVSRRGTMAETQTTTAESSRPWKVGPAIENNVRPGDRYRSAGTERPAAATA